MVSQEQIKTIAEHTKAFLRSEIRQIEKAQLMTSGKIVESDRLRGRKASILIVDGLTQKLPDNLELFTYSCIPIHGAQKNRIRNAFNNTARKSVLQRAFRDEEDALIRMKLLPQHLEFLEKGYVPKTQKGRLFDLSVDHMIEVSDGGSNDENLYIVPVYFNLYKSTFTQLQKRAGLTEILSIRPKPNGGRQTLVPIFEGGYRLATSNGPIIRQRMEALLGMKLE